MKIFSRIKQTVHQIVHLRYLKYVVAAIIGVAIVGFLDESSVWKHIQNRQRISALQDEIKTYDEQYRHDKSEMDRLDASPRAIERIARERYFMKKDDEDVFVLSDDSPQTLLTEEDETAE